MKEKKSEVIHMKVTLSIKEMAQKMAKKRNLTISNYIADLIRNDALKEETKMTKFLVEKIGLCGLPNSTEFFDTQTEIFDTQEEANDRAVQIWGSLTDAEKKKYHVYVADVTEDDIDPDAIQRYKKVGGEFPWTEYLYAGHVSGNFNSFQTDILIVATENTIEYTVRGKKIEIDISERLKQKEVEKEQGILDEVKFTVACIEEDIKQIESEIEDSLFFVERQKIYEALANFYEFSVKKGD